MCFSNLFKNGGSNFNCCIWRLLTKTITWKLRFTSEDILAYSKAILAYCLFPIIVKF